MARALRAIGRPIGRWLGALPPFAVLCLGWLVLVIYAFPGQMTQDSFDHLREARTGIYSDSHPPTINLLWKISDSIVAGQFGMLVLQSTTLLAGLYLILRRTFAPRRAAWLAVAVYVFPPVMVPMAVIWKDCIMAGFLALGAAGLLSERRAAKLWGLAAMLGATAVRYNAFGATLPLVVLLFEWRPGMPWLRRYALAAAAWLAITFAAFGINAALTDREMHYWHSSLALYDIVGTLAHVDGDLPDAELRELLAGTDLLIQRDIHAVARKVYSTRDFFPIVNDEKYTMWNVPINGYDAAPQAQRDAIGRAWWRTITTYPGAYLAHRIAVTADVLGFSDNPGAGAITKREFRYPEYANQLGLGTGWSQLQHRMTKWMRALWRATPLFVPYVYAFIALLLLPLALRQRDVLAILLSGLVMESTLIPLAHSNDYRYSHWMVICSLLGAILLGARRYRARSPSPASSPV
ncbi:MAG TPA: hypothetical protein VN253_14305 [Kofleriaceae bacterium]|nr:hypothetical protein [Kofleriaceae bacterium]